MLITICTHCLARFRVTPQQLNVKQGQVRCGRCGKVFSGFEALERFPDDDTGARLLAAREAEERGLMHPAPAEDLPDEELGAAAAERAVSVPVPAVEEQPKAAAQPPRPAARPVAMVVPAEEESEPRRPSILWAIGSVLLALLVGAELAYAFRSPLAQRYPALRPSLQSACVHLACTISWSRDERLIKLEESELLEVPGRPGEIALGARLRNLASVPQEYPHLELTLTDIGGQAAARRVLKPSDYLGRAPAPDEALPAGSEIAIQLRLATPRIRATGYELLLFYP